MIPYGQHHLDEEDIQAVVDVLRSGSLTQGPMVEAFEQAIADYVGCKYAVAVSSCTAGLHLAALAAGVGPGTTLITTPITFVASANAGRYAGADVSFADIDLDTQNMSVIALEQSLKRNANTKAVVPVHYAGLPCDMPAIQSLADAASAAVIEDAAHALGACYPDGRRVGCCANSLMTVFSFHPVKAIAAGEGGMVTTNDDAVYHKLVRLRSHGINKLDDPLTNDPQVNSAEPRKPWYYEMQELGFHYRLTELQCALGMSQLKKLDKFIERRRRLVFQYDEAFSGMKHFRPSQLSGRELSGHHLYVLKIDFDSIGLSRSQLMRELKLRNVGTQVHYIPIPSHPYYQTLGHRLDTLPNAQSFYNEALSIPLFYNLTNEQQNYVISQLKDLLL